MLSFGYPLIVLEGLSGVGKTTIGGILAKEMQGILYKMPPEPFLSVRDVIDQEACLKARFVFYLAGILQAVEEIKEILIDKPVICDRYLLTTICYYLALGVDTNDLMISSSCLLKPDFSFLIICENNLRLKRLKDRELSFNDKQEQKFNIEQKVLAEYKKFNLIEIDNSANDPLIAVKTILEIINGPVA